MELRDQLCVCGHLQPFHRTYGCTGSRPNPDAKKTDRTWWQCKAFHAKELMRCTEDSRLRKAG